MTRALGVFAVVLAVSSPATAEKAKPSAPAKQSKADKAAKEKAAAKQAEEEAAEAEAAEDAAPTPEEIEASLPPHIKGPKLVDLGYEIEIELPEGMILLERAEARKMIEEGGGSGENVRAVVFKPDANWTVIIDYDDVGYVTDTDAHELDANELFQLFVEGTRQQNVKRKSMGIPELFLDGWSEMPSYKRELHHLVWGLKGHASDGPFINFFTRILGRNGFLSVNLIDSPEAIEQSKIDSQSVLNATRFKTGARYEDHQEGDKSSGLGLKALVLGGAGLGVAKAAKAGFLVKLLLVFKKGFWVLILAIGGLFKWLLGRKKQEDEYPQDPPMDPPASMDPPVPPPATPPSV